MLSKFKLMPILFNSLSDKFCYYKFYAVFGLIFALFFEYFILISFWVCLIFRHDFQRLLSAVK
jgi:hypothetical protein